jgi:hypothetical protein
MPTKIPCASEPVNQRNTDKKKDSSAANKIDAFAIFILELMLIHSYETSSQ